jgi:non-heme chloroperoxidase
MDARANPPASTSAAPPSTRRIPLAGGIEIAVDAWGDPAADPVVFLHGGGQTRHAWGETASQLAQRGFHALTLDLRGHGESSWAADGDYRLDAFVGDLRQVLAGLERPAAVVGASLGGMTALLAAGEAPRSAVSALVLVDIAARIERRGADRIVSFMLSRPDGFADLDEAADAIAAYQPHRQRPRDTSGLAKNLRRGADGRWRWHWDPRFLAGVGSPGSGDTPTRLDAAARNLTAPTLLVRGRLSDLLSEEGAQHFLALVPHARFEDVAGAGHMVAGDRNDLFNTAVIDFLCSLRESRS